MKNEMSHTFFQLSRKDIAMWAGYTYLYICILFFFLFHSRVTLKGIIRVHATNKIKEIGGMRKYIIHIKKKKIMAGGVEYATVKDEKKKIK